MEILSVNIHLSQLTWSSFSKKNTQTISSEHIRIISCVFIIVHICIDYCMDCYSMCHDGQSSIHISSSSSMEAHRDTNRPCTILFNVIVRYTTNSKKVVLCKL